MNCLAQRKKFKNKHPAWNDPSEPELPIDPIQSNDVAEKDPDHSSSSESDDDDELVAGEVRSKKLRLESKELRFKHVTNVNNERSYNGSVKQVQFHPTSKIALVTLLRSQADLFEIDGERNRHIQNIKLPFSKKPFCAFKPDGGSIVISSENFSGNFYSYDMVSGDIKKYAIKVGKESRDMTDFVIQDDLIACRYEGSSEVLVLSTKTYETMFTLKLNEPARAIQFTNNHEIFIASESAKVYIWDLRKTKLCKHKFQDEGSVSISSFALSNSARSLSLGSDCGIVNSYDLDDCYKSKFPSPSKVYSNLKEPVDMLRYNHTGELLLMSSSQQFEGFRLAHTLSSSVYKNFPTSKKRYGKLYGADFSPSDGYLALGCSSGRAHLCRLPYYKSY